MNAISAAVLGGTSMAGGVGTIGGTIVGAFVIGVINDGMVMCGVLLATLPLFIIFLLFSRQFTADITAGAIKS